MIEQLTPIEFTANVFSKVRSEGTEAASEWVAEYVSSGFISEDNYRVRQARSQIYDAQLQTERFDKYVANEDKNAKLKKGEPQAIDPIAGIPSRFWPSSSQGLYQTSVQAHAVSHYFHDSHLDQYAKKIFKSADFGDSPQEIIDDRISIAKDVRVSALGWSDATAISGDGTYHPTRSSRLARLTGDVIVSPASDEIEFAYLLPFPYAPKNYYHSMTEMVYGLRHVHTVDSSTPIIYDVDPFEMLPTVAKALKIPSERFTRRSEVKNSVIRTAVLPDPGPYYWSSQFARFFRSIWLNSDPDRKSAKRIYISRARSPRSLPDERRIESHLRAMSFHIVYAEDLSFKDQIKLFGNADVIIGAHGAGMSNSVFAADNTLIGEIFHPDYVIRDFQKRCQYITPNYRAFLTEKSSLGTVIEDLTSVLNEFNVR